MDSSDIPIKNRSVHLQDDESSKEMTEDISREPTISKSLSPYSKSEEHPSKEMISANSTFSSNFTAHAPPPPPPPPPNPPRRKANRTPRVNNKKPHCDRKTYLGDSSSLQQITTKLHFLEASSSREDESSGSSQFGQIFPSHISPRSVVFENEFHSKEKVKNLQRTVDSLQGMVESLQQQQQTTNNYLTQLFEQINLLHNQVKDQNEEKKVMLEQLQELSTQNYRLKEANKSFCEKLSHCKKVNAKEETASLETILQNYLLSEHSYSTKRGSLSESEIVSMIVNGVEEKDNKHTTDKQTSRQLSKAKRIQSKLYDKILESVLNDLEAEVLEEESSISIPTHASSSTSKQIRDKIRDWRQIHQHEDENIEDYANRVFNTYLELRQKNVDFDENDLHYTFIMGLGESFSSIRTQAKTNLPDEWNVSEFGDLVQVAQAYLNKEELEEKVEEEEPTTIRMFVRSLI